MIFLLYFDSWKKRGECISLQLFISIASKQTNFVYNLFTSCITILPPPQIAKIVIFHFWPTRWRSYVAHERHLVTLFHMIARVGGELEKYTKIRVRARICSDHFAVPRPKVLQKTVYLVVTCVLIGNSIIH